MSIVVYHYAGCSTCRKARKHLTAAGCTATLIDLKAAPPSAATLATLHAASGLPLKRFFNTSGQSYRSGGWKDRLPGLSDAEAYAALAADGMLIKRPILSATGTDGTHRVVVGFSVDAWDAALNGAA